jgi:hypothetical protein
MIVFIDFIGARRVSTPNAGDLTGLQRPALLLSAPERPSSLTHSTAPAVRKRLKDRQGFTCTHLDSLPGSRFK